MCQKLLSVNNILTSSFRALQESHFVKSQWQDHFILLDLVGDS